MTERIDALIRLKAKTNEVTRTLTSHGIPLQEWGIGGAKTVRHLAEEIIKGETALVVKDGELIRNVSMVKVDVRYRKPDGGELQLVEDRQEFTDGAVKRRGLNGVSEKMKPGEDPLAAAARGLIEELKIEEKCVIDDLGCVREVLTSKSYPGLVTEYAVHNTRTYIPDSAFKPEYVELQDDKSTYFVWREVTYGD